MDGFGNWTRVKDILGWLINNHWGALALSSKIRLDLLSILAITTTQRRILVNNMERLISNLLSMQLAVPGAIVQFYTMQVALTCARASKNATANLPAQFH